MVDYVFGNSVKVDHAKIFEFCHASVTGSSSHTKPGHEAPLSFGGMNGERCLLNYKLRSGKKLELQLLIYGHSTNECPCAGTLIYRPGIDLGKTFFALAGEAGRFCNL